MKTFRSIARGGAHVTGVARSADRLLLPCRKCGDELLVPFACKGRGCCPSCMGRRMAEGAALLVDHALPAVGYRPWVLSFEGRQCVWATTRRSWRRSPRGSRGR